ncbi:MAG: hypothetical protein EBZ49_01360 [Proteobacteria bacterium]|nr:hypothetical protein [Pseudomonadota bacterium]
MNYKKIYDSLIVKAKLENRKKYRGVFYEAHHIIPKCMGGEGRAFDWRTHENIVLLTAKEHLLAHLLLCEIYPNSKPLKYALFSMVSYKNKGRKNNLKVSIRQYERIREEFSKINSEAKKGNKNRSGIGFSEDAINKIRLAQLGTKQEKIQCPHCKIVGGSRALKQYHFDNCKKKPGNEHINRERSKLPRYKCEYCKFVGTEKILAYHKKTCNNRPNKPPKKGDWSEETNKRRSESMKGKNKSPHKIVECPHCKKIGGHSIMQRIDYDN